MSSRARVHTCIPIDLHSACAPLGSYLTRQLSGSAAAGDSLPTPDEKGAMLTWAWARDDGNMCEYGARECGALTHARAAWKASGAEADAIGEMNTLYSFDFIRMRQRGTGP